MVRAGPGDLVYKPRGQWHTFWNAGDEPCRILEIISPAGFERFFAELGPLAAGGAPDPETMGELCARYALEMDPASPPELCSRLGLWFPASGSRARQRAPCTAPRPHGIGFTTGVSYVGRSWIPISSRRSS